MAYLLSSERPATAAVPVSPLGALVRWLANRRARRVQRVTLESLLELEPHRLDDLGVTRRDLFEAIHEPTQRPGLLLARRRARAAENWLNP